MGRKGLKSPWKNFRRNRCGVSKIKPLVDFKADFLDKFLKESMKQIRRNFVDNFLRKIKVIQRNFKMNPRTNIWQKYWKSFWMSLSKIFLENPWRTFWRNSELLIFWRDPWNHLWWNQWMISWKYIVGGYVSEAIHRSSKITFETLFIVKNFRGSL